MKGIDIRLNRREGHIDFQVYKVSERKEARGKTRSGVINIPYPVISRAELIRKIRSPHTRKKETYETMLRIFDKYYEELENGFIVFKKELAKDNPLGDPCEACEDEAINTFLDALAKIFRLCEERG